MPSKRNAIAALKKLETERLALDKRKRELEEKASLELGRAILGTGIETFSKKGLVKIATELGKLGEEDAIARLVDKSGSASLSPQRP
ncbi:hypothetical protein INR77_04690 [Erythrobacter sp. SCSIO 43205]|uniref:DUF6437 family protein n=1 Tax=Erythrobacter sp. SCSIO 43205 TaxID=2779361 RepID=UPI001CAA2CED|nr:DUF6437 family protein [Erythrobacter sp. SCSIO 43205]UAB78998.1 hypothetical protein INR77_04690 [Erythrobacter sp. SCSIO 43205]